jgi:hypothetical protein
MKKAGIIILVVIVMHGFGQQYYDDAQFRFNLGLEMKLNKRFAVTLDQQDRFTKNVADFTRASLDLGLSYKINRFIRVKADYVFITKKNNLGYFTERNWYYGAVVLKHDIGKWKFFYRNMYQVRMAPVNSYEAGISRTYDRNKLTIRHETTRRLSLWVAEEIYIPLNSPATKGIERARHIGGLTIKTFKGQEVDLYFMLQQYLQRNKWFDQNYRYYNGLMRRDWIYGVNYTIAF